MRTLFTLDHALSSADGQCRRSEFLTYILETKVPGLHFNADDEERLPKSTMPTLMLPAVRPRMVDGAREDYMIAGHLRNGEGRDSDNAAMKILEEQVDGEEKMFTGGKPIEVDPDGIFHSQCLELLLNLPKRNLEDRETICRALLDMADRVKVLPPGNEPLSWNVLNMTQWKDSLWELVKEMKTVEEKCPSLMRTSGVFVLTTTPYSEFLRALYGEIADAAEKINQIDE